MDNHKGSIYAYKHSSSPSITPYSLLLYLETLLTITQSSTQTKRYQNLSSESFSKQLLKGFLYSKYTPQLSVRLSHLETATATLFWTRMSATFLLAHITERNLVQERPLLFVLPRLEAFSQRRPGQVPNGEKVGKKCNGCRKGED